MRCKHSLARWEAGQAKAYNPVFSELCQSQAFWGQYSESQLYDWSNQFSIVKGQRDDAHWHQVWNWMFVDEWICVDVPSNVLPGREINPLGIWTKATFR